MIQARHARHALQSLAKARRFSSTPSAAAVSPYRRTAQSVPSTAVKDTPKRDQSTAAATAQDRAIPSPAFNREDTTRWHDVQPLRPFRQPEMDHSFVGKKGGEIFHEMMLRHGVKHVCKYTPLNCRGKHWTDSAMKSATLVVPSYPSSMPSTTRRTSTSSFPDTSKAQGTWQRAMQGLLASPVLFS